MATLSEIFTNIANAIRSKTSKTATMTPAEMATEIGTLVKPSTTKGTTTYTPTTLNQTISAGTYCSGVQTIKGDANLVAENIKGGVSIFGVDGSLESGGGDTITIVNSTGYSLIIFGNELKANATVSVPIPSTTPAGFILFEDDLTGRKIRCYVDGVAQISGLSIFVSAMEVKATFADDATEGISFFTWYQAFFIWEDVLPGSIVEIQII